MRFQQGETAVIADIKQVHQEKKAPLIETDALRFLWKYNPPDHPAENPLLLPFSGKADLPCCCNRALRQVSKKLDSGLLDILT